MVKLHPSGHIPATESTSGTGNTHNHRGNGVDNIYTQRIGITPLQSKAIK